MQKVVDVPVSIGVVTVHTFYLMWLCRVTIHNRPRQESNSDMEAVKIGTDAPELSLVGSDGATRRLVADSSGLTVLYLMRAWT
jgi:hypothetical protein